jgi:hypothetical protein
MSSWDCYVCLHERTLRGPKAKSFTLIEIILTSPIHETWSGWRFVAGFLFRHKDLVVARSPKPTDIKRLQLKMSNIEQFIEKAGSVLSKFKGDPNLIINVDETFAILML